MPRESESKRSGRVNRQKYLQSVGGPSKENEETESGGVGRRRYLKSLGISGLALAGIPLVSGAGDSIEIVLTRNPDGSPSDTTTVSRRWYNQTKNAEKRAKKLGKRVLGKQGVASVGVGTTSSSTGGLRNKAIEVGLYGQETEADIPEHVEGTPVQVTKNVDYDYTCYTGSYSDLKAGVSVESSQGMGTTCSRVMKNGSEYLLTARHLFTSDGTGCSDGGISFDGTPVYRNGSQIGTIVGGSVEHDMVYVDLNTNITDGIVDELATVAGHVTQDGLSTFSSNGQELRRRGISTCATRCTISSYDNILDCGNNILLTELVHYDSSTLSEPGDSGGPVYYKANYGDAKMASITSGIRNVSCGWFCNKDVIFGAAAYAMTKWWSGDFSFD